MARGDAPETRVIEMGRSSGTFTFSYDTQHVADQMVVRYESRSAGTMPPDGVGVYGLVCELGKPFLRRIDQLRVAA